MTGSLNMTGTLTSTADSFESTASTVQNLTNNMVQTVNKLTGNVWSGNAQQKYTTQFKGLQDDINRMISMIKEHVADLRAMARNYEATEQANQETASALASDVIS